jgi:hypothetical protein
MLCDANFLLLARVTYTATLKSNYKWKFLTAYQLTTTFPFSAATQAFLELEIGSTKLEQVMLLSTQLLTEAILGLDFLINYQAEISFPEWRITLRQQSTFIFTSLYHYI